MHGSLPLVRLINGFSQPSPSRIPHLTLHILRRGTPSSAHWDVGLCFPNARYLRRFQRPSSTNVSFSPFILPNQTTLLDEHDDLPPIEYGVQEVPAADSTRGARKLVSMQALLEENNPDRILLGLVTPQIGDDFIENADDQTFARAICALDPEHFIVPYGKLFRYLKPSLETQPKFRIVRSLEERVATFINILDSLVTQRQKHGHSLGLDIYRHLLRCTAAAGVGSFARNVFRKAMREDDIEPDLDCYNYFMEALTWNEAYNRHERYRLRIVRHNMFRRSLETRPLGFFGHGVASPKNPKNEQSIRLETLGIFNELVNQGLNGNEATFCNLMVAMGREGDLGSVKSVLKSAWNIDVDALDKYDEEELESPTFYEEGSPLRPSARLLFTVVHVFGTNNEVALGGMLLDYISRNYNLEIPEYIWTHLLEWTFVLSIQHSKARIERGHGEGRIARRAVESVYHVFHNEPYNVQPKIEDLIFRVKARSEARKLYKAVEDLRQCMVLLEEERTRLSEMHDQIRQLLEDADYHYIFYDGLPSPAFLDLKHKYVLASLQLECHIQLISIAVRNTIKRKDWTSHDEGTDWPYRGIPNIIAEWTDWLPNIIPYYTPTGHVCIWGRESRHAAIQSANSLQTTRTGTMRMLLDSYSPTRLRHAAGFIHRGPTGNALTKFQDEVRSDSSGRLSDWVLRFEAAVRQERLNDRQVVGAQVPGPDHHSEDWRPWGGIPGKGKTERGRRKKAPATRDEERDEDEHEEGEKQKA
ncbi:uncharacterized protein PV07_00536 [Cladophialophora immunda]|uniref:Uncharacterized protein n=1 Tax=Cladophialophora immunda TaxID=569365 RepID=A0A0D2CR72_9EURO|nr:uncharacterized protein PV07_00536 [Cladophialophora immunda]KIW33708.1 hypothetical protein PV07_00536 [Cladophialophora immunda]